MRSVWILSLALLPVLGGCKDRTSGSPGAGQPYVVRPVRESLSPEDVRAAFYALGLQVERFDCVLPRAGQLHLVVRRYVNGQLVATPGKSSVSVEAGNQRFLLFTHKQGSSLAFTFARVGATTSWGQIDTSGYGAATWKALGPATLAPGQEIPLYVYAASNGDLAVSALSTAEQFITQYPLAIVVSAEWQPNHGS